MEANTMTQLVLPAALFCIMMGVGLSLVPADFRRLLEQPRPVLTGLLLQLGCLPLLALAMVSALQLPVVVAAGLLLVSFAPGGATSNMITYLVRGDTALSVSLTALSSLVTPLTLPLLTLWLVVPILPAAELSGFPVLATTLKLMVIALLPVLLGMLIRKLLPAFSLQLETPVRVLSLLFLLVVVVGIVLGNQERLLPLLLSAGPAALLLMLAALMLGYLGGRAMRLPSRQALTLAVETGIQNAGTALLVSAGVLQDAQMSAVVLCYGVVMNLPVIALIIYRNRPGYRAA